GLTALGWRVQQRAFFDTITVEVGARQSEILDNAAANGINLRKMGAGAQARIGISCDETTTPAVIEAVWRAFGSHAKGQVPRFEQLSARAGSASPAPLAPPSDCPNHPPS